MTKKIPKILHVKPDMVVSEIVGLFPEAAEIITSYGLHCVGCHVSSFETLEEGLMGHGYPQEHLDSLVADLNECIDELNQGSNPQDLPQTADKIKIKLTDVALKRVKEIAEEEDKKSILIKVDVRKVGQEFKYGMNFVEKKELSEFHKVFAFAKKTVQVAVDKRDWKKMDGLEIDFVQEKERAGFKMNNPNI